MAALVIRETRELLVALKRMNEGIPRVVLELMDGSLSVERQVAFGELLVRLGRLVQEHARAETPGVIDGGADGELPAPPGQL